jgi:hypothetical protein
MANFTGRLVVPCPPGVGLAHEFGHSSTSLTDPRTASLGFDWHTRFCVARVVAVKNRQECVE